MEEPEQVTLNWTKWMGLLRWPLCLFGKHWIWKSRAYMGGRDLWHECFACGRILWTEKVRPCEGYSIDWVEKTFHPKLPSHVSKYVDIDTDDPEHCQTCRLIVELYDKHGDSDD